MTKNFPSACDGYHGFARRMEAEGRQQGARTPSSHNAGQDALGIGNQPQENEIDAQRRSELENLMTTLTTELRERLEHHQQVHSRTKKLKRERDDLFATLRDIEEATKANLSLPGARDVLDVVREDSQVRHVI